jgi:hypothetical protein
MNVRVFRGIVSAISTLFAISVGMLVGTLTAVFLITLLWGYISVS